MPQGKKNPVDIAAVKSQLVRRELMEPIVLICKEKHVTLEAVFGIKTSKMIVIARDAVITYLRDLGFSYTEVADLMGMNHNSIMKAVARHRRRSGDGSRAA